MAIKPEVKTMKNTKKKLNYIVLYRDECTQEQWEAYAYASNCDENANEIKIWFDPNLVEATKCEE